MYNYMDKSGREGGNSQLFPYPQKDLSVPDSLLTVATLHVVQLVSISPAFTCEAPFCCDSN